ncbi:SlyX protein [[Haemophilus] ducreyi]|uniref:Protein SlyX homolog n=2 Tax=Haemophilus ducreyi TaxID=730 RepID=SLYX_HAEDU|nr:SlyX family protein [[Haemophilus] ducreyi]Q7VKJ9.1 RecName: Full=Protein SlyX homolog [[Haemophilus] ducreyi 35000HP]AAP96628.1 SlyX protein [[Haemophilus] ducreyi 35000HP]AKO31467.1 SlyX [[Haemophilus] ducreyi]AKO32921.1 SlyX [[Haemophilus] ducreyi]AKO34367.1 SlyX [[Haemophilus] ducreyi]AKO35812.1 SlyX [[Haemophilus] ducreyi]
MTTQNELLNRIAELETKVAFQDNVIEELNQVLIHHQFVLDKLQTQVRHFANKFKNIQSSNVASQAEETPPPHY